MPSESSSIATYSSSSSSESSSSSSIETKSSSSSSSSVGTKSSSSSSSSIGTRSSSSSIDTKSSSSESSILPAGGPDNLQIADLGTTVLRGGAYLSSLAIDTMTFSWTWSGDTDNWDFEYSNSRIGEADSWTNIGNVTTIELSDLYKGSREFKVRAVWDGLSGAEPYTTPTPAATLSYDLEWPNVADMDSLSVTTEGGQTEFDILPTDVDVALASEDIETVYGYKINPAAKYTDDTAVEDDNIGRWMDSSDNYLVCSGATHTVVWNKDSTTGRLSNPRRLDGKGKVAISGDYLIIGDEDGALVYEKYGSGHLNQWGHEVNLGGEDSAAVDINGDYAIVNNKVYYRTGPGNAWDSGQDVFVGNTEEIYDVSLDVESTSGRIYAAKAYHVRQSSIHFQYIDINYTTSNPNTWDTANVTTETLSTNGSAYATHDSTASLDLKKDNLAVMYAISTFAYSYMRAGEFHIYERTDVNAWDKKADPYLDITYGSPDSHIVYSSVKFNDDITKVMYAGFCLDTEYSWINLLTKTGANWSSFSKDWYSSTSNPDEHWFESVRATDGSNAYSASINWDTETLYVGARDNEIAENSGAIYAAHDDGNFRFEYSVDGEDWVSTGITPSFSIESDEGDHSLTARLANDFGNGRIYTPYATWSLSYTDNSSSSIETYSSSSSSSSIETYSSSSPSSSSSIVTKSSSSTALEQPSESSVITYSSSSSSSTIRFTSESSSIKTYSSSSSSPSSSLSSSSSIATYSSSSSSSSAYGLINAPDNVVATVDPATSTVNITWDWTNTLGNEPSTPTGFRIERKVGNSDYEVITWAPSGATREYDDTLTGSTALQVFGGDSELKYRIIAYWLSA